eukprot:g55429.t1
MGFTGFPPIRLLPPSHYCLRVMGRCFLFSTTSNPHNFGFAFPVTSFEMHNQLGRFLAITNFSSPSKLHSHHNFVVFALSNSSLFASLCSLRL